MIDVLNSLYARGNPYQKLMYSSARYRCVPGKINNVLGHAAKLGGVNGRYLHLHWDDRIFGRGENAEENQAIEDETLGNLRRFRDQGGRILWTIHNASPHFALDVDAFQAARHALCDVVSQIHVHAPHARDYMIENYSVQEAQLSIVPHPSYLGAYEPEADTLSRPLPIAENRRFLMFGLLRANKGLGALYEAIKTLQRKGARYQVEIHGKAFKGSLRTIRFLNLHENVEAVPERVPDEDVAAVFARSQVYVAPFTDSFTSGSIMLAQTFGLPVIGPDLPALRESVPESARSLLYPANAPRGLYRKMQEAIQMDDAELNALRQDCFNFAKERSPNLVSAELAAVLDRI